MVTWSAREGAYIARHKIARLATVDQTRQPLVVPVCYASTEHLIYSVIDLKPKKVAPGELKRVRNIQATPNVSLVIDEYHEDWSKLSYIIINGNAEIIERGPEHRTAIELLREKYPQYVNMAIDDAPVIRITPTKVISWGVL